MNRMYEDFKIDTGLASQALNNTNATGRYFPRAGFHKVIAILQGGAMAATKTTKVEFLQAQDASGTGAKGIPSDVAQAAVAEITANTNVTEATIDTTNGANTNTVTINDVVFTQAAATDATKREFQNAAGLVTCINDPTYGVSGASASADGAVVTVQAKPAGGAVFTITGHANFTIATTQAQAYVEVENFSLDHANGFTHLAVKVTTTANTVVSAAVLRGYSRDHVTQKVGAGAAV